MQYFQTQAYKDYERDTDIGAGIDYDEMEAELEEAGEWKMLMREDAI